MPRARRSQVLVATDGSASARAALATAVSFPWPAEARGSAVVAKTGESRLSPVDPAGRTRSHVGGQCEPCVTGDVEAVAGCVAQVVDASRSMEF